MLTSSSSGQVIPFEPASQPNRPTFAQAREAWLRTALADRELTSGEARLCAAVFLHFNREHYEKIGELIAWPTWTTLMAGTTLAKRTIADGFEKLERLRLLEVEHGRHATKRRERNLYHVPPRCGLAHLAPDQGARPRCETKVHPAAQDSLIGLIDKTQLSKKGKLSKRKKKRDSSWTPEEGRSETKKENPSPSDSPLPAAPFKNTMDVPRRDPVEAARERVAAYKANGRLR